jgi:two-component system phosphate regulon response regulator PhoB
MYTVGPMRVDVDGHHVFVEGREVHVSATGMRLLVYLISARGRVCGRQELHQGVWGYKPDTTSRTVEAHVKLLRRNLGVARKLIETVRGAGYRLSDDYPVVVEGDHLP